MQQYDFQPIIEQPNLLTPGWEVPAAILAGLLTIALLLIAWVDHKTKIIPDRVTGPMAAITLLTLPFMWQNPVNHLIAGLVIFVPLFGMTYLTSGGKWWTLHLRLMRKADKDAIPGFGMGDVKLYVIAGFLFGHAVIAVMIIAGIVGLAQGVYAYVKYRDLEMRIPHGPHIVAAMLAVMALAAFAF